jgi:hypothetical protein
VDNATRGGPYGVSVVLTTETPYAQLHADRSRDGAGRRRGRGRIDSRGRRRCGMFRRYPAYWATILVKSYGFWLMLLQVPGAHGSTAPAGQGWSRLNDQNVNHAT